jgi:hypothetical protein
MGESLFHPHSFSENGIDDIVPHQLPGTVTPTRGRVDLSSVYGETWQTSQQEAGFEGKGEKVISSHGLTCCITCIV